MSTNNTYDLSSDKQEKSMLDQFLAQWELDYIRFAEYLGVDYTTLYRYRKGQREFALTMEQIQKLDKLLAKVGKRLSDLPADWYRDREVSKKT